MRRATHPVRRGTVLVWFALVVWVLLAVAALVIDLGLVRTTQRQMQSITDSAAVEGVRALDQTPQQRRDAAQQMVDLALADTQTGDPQRFGAGPQFELTGGIPLQDGFSASQTLSIGNPRVYHPVLNTNEANALDGDLVRGTYNPGLTTANPEQSGYARADLTPSNQGNALLIRLRRSNENIPADDPSRSRAEPLPLLFGRGSLVSSEAKGRGITVRATSIAAARPVMSAGSAQGAPFNLPGVARLSLRASSWNAWRSQPSGATATSITVTVAPDGNITAPVTGWFTGQINQLVMIGDPVSTRAVRSDLSALERYVPLFDSVPGRGEVIIGFLHITGVTVINATTVEIALTTQVAQGNATTALVRPLSGWDGSSLSALFTARGNLVDPLRAPALVR